MKIKQVEGKEDYVVDIYEAKIQVAIARWDASEYRQKEKLLLEQEKERQ